MSAQKYLVSIYLADGEVDNDARSAAVRRGMAARAREGAHTFRPPVGYRAIYAGRRRVGIEPDDEAPAVVAAFERAADPDRPLTEVRAALNTALCRRAFESMNAAKRFLQRRVSVGDVPVPVAAQGELGEWAPGTHAPIVGPELWRAVQDRLDGRARRYARRRPVHPDLYLRGLVHAAGETLTGSGVRSRHGYRVWYYHGQGRGAVRVSAPAVHEAVGDWLAAHAPPAGLRELVRSCVVEEWARAMAGADEARDRARRDDAVAARRLERATEALLDGHIGPDAYGPIADRLRAERDRALAAAEAAQLPAADPAALDAALALAADLVALYGAADPEGCREPVGSIMPAGVGVAEGGVIEPLPSPLLALLSGLDGPETAGTHNGRPGGDGRFAGGYAREDSNL